MKEISYDISDVRDTRYEIWESVFFWFGLAKDHNIADILLAPFPDLVPCKYWVFF